MIRDLRPLLFLFALAASAHHAFATEGERCYADWSAAAPIVEREQLMAIDALMTLAHQRFAGTVLKATLCREKAQFVYRIVVRERDGLIRTHAVDARKP